MNNRQIDTYWSRRLVRAQKQIASPLRTPATVKLQIHKGVNCVGPRPGTAEFAVVDTLTITPLPETPLRVTDGVTGLQLARAGTPVHEMVTNCVDPFSGITVSENEACWPGFTVCIPEADVIVKSGKAFTFCVKECETLEANDEFPA